MDRHDYAFPFRIDLASRQAARTAYATHVGQLIRQVLQGGGEMPAYGRSLSPPEVTALVAFLSTLHPAGVPAARASDAHDVP